MVTFTKYGRIMEGLDYSEVDERGEEIASMIDDRSGLGNDFLGWLDFASKMPNEEIEKIQRAAAKIRDNFEALVVVGIGGSYLGARAAIDAINGLFPSDKLEILYLGNNLAPNYIEQVLNHLKGRKFAVNVVSKSGTTTEPSVAFRFLKALMVKEHSPAYLKDAIYCTTDSKQGALVRESAVEGYQTFVIPDDIGGRYSVITPVGLLPIACAGIDIKKFLAGVIEGEKQYSVHDYHKNPAYLYGATRYLLNIQKHYVAEMFIAYEPQYKMIAEWLKQLFDESEGKDDKGIFCGSGIFTTDLHSMGQFIQQGTPCLFETILRTTTPMSDVTVPEDKDNLDNLNYLAGKKLSYINDQAYFGTLNAHTNGHTPAQIIEIPEMDAYNLGNLMYFFFRAVAFSGYLLGVNPFNQPGVEIYKSNMFKLLGKPFHKK